MSFRTAVPTRAQHGRRGTHRHLHARHRTHVTNDGELISVRGGAHVLIRPIRSTDGALLTGVFDRMSVRSRRLRFLAAKSELTPAELRYLVNVDHVNHEALIAVDVAEGAAVGVARYVRDRHDPRAAEIAVTVVDAWHRRGVATALLTRLTERAQTVGIASYTALVSADNVAVLELLHDYAVDPVVVAADDFGLIEARIRIPAGTAVSC